MDDPIMEDEDAPFTFDVDETDYVVPPPDWNKNVFRATTQDDWCASIHRCYDNLPKEALKKFKFVYTMDTDKQWEIKTDAAYHALSFILDKFDEDYACALDSEKYRRALQTQAEHYFCCLRTFHPLTMHTRVVGFEEHFNDANLFTCPFGQSASKWRRYYSVEFIVDGKVTKACSCN